MRIEPTIPGVTPAEIERVVRRRYPGDQFGAVMTLLQTCRPGDPQEAADRVRVAVLKLSAGQLEVLRGYVKTANYDSAEILARAERPGYRQIEVRISNDRVPTELQQRIIEEDRIQYGRTLPPVL